MREVLVSTPVIGAFFLALVYGLYRLGGVLAAKGEEHPGKRQPYACGEDILLPEVQLGYHAFFQLALMFSLLHLATLVVSVVPQSGLSRWIAFVYLLGISVSVLVLTKEA